MSNELRSMRSADRVLHQLFKTPLNADNYALDCQLLNRLTSLCTYSGSPAFRKPSLHRSKSFGRRYDITSLRLESLNSGAASRRCCIILCDSVCRPARVLLATATAAVKSCLGLPR